MKILDKGKIEKMKIIGNKGKDYECAKGPF
jgi:hypothetical protein